MKTLNLSMVVLIAFFSLSTINSNAQTSGQTYDIVVNGTSGSHTYADAEEGDYLGYVSGIGDATTISINGGSNETIPYPNSPQVIKVVETLWADGKGGWLLVNLIFDDNEYIGMDVIGPYCPC